MRLSQDNLRLAFPNVANVNSLLTSRTYTLASFFSADGDDGMSDAAIENRTSSPNTTCTRVGLGQFVCDVVDDTGNVTRAVVETDVARRLAGVAGTLGGEYSDPLAYTCAASGDGSANSTLRPCVETLVRDFRVNESLCEGNSSLATSPICAPTCRERLNLRFIFSLGVVSSETTSCQPAFGNSSQSSLINDVAGVSVDDTRRQRLENIEESYSKQVFDVSKNESGL